MKKFAMLTAVVVMLAASTASAKDMRGKFGVGYGHSLGGASGLALSYFVNNSFGVDALLGFGFVSPDEGDSKMAFDLDLAIRYNIARAKDVNLGVGIGVALGFRNDAAVGGEDSLFQANIEVPITVEYFFSEHFAIYLATGVTVEIVPEDGKVLDAAGTKVESANKDFGVHFFNGGLFGDAGFKFYF